MPRTSTPKIDTVAIQLDLLHDWLASRPRARGVPTSVLLQRDADAGDKRAKRVLAARIFETPAGTKFVTVVEPVAAVSVTVANLPMGKRGRPGKPPKPTPAQTFNRRPKAKVRLTAPAN
jgi:hypothetical protein